MKYPQRRRTAASTSAAITAFLLAGLTGTTLNAREWQAWLGAQSRDMGSQALAFLPNEFWIHTNDSIRWTLASTEIHTVTFLIPGPPRATETAIVRCRIWSSGRLSWNYA
jgi:plastocyanin